MIDVVLLAIAAIASIVAAFFVACLAFIVRREQPALSKDVLWQMLRAETDVVNRAGDDQARGLRQELTNSLSAFQEGTQKAFKMLIEFMSTRLSDFGMRLDSSIKTMDEKVEGIGVKLSENLGQMAFDANNNRDTLRQLIEAKLDDAVIKHSVSSKELREEMNSSFDRLGDNVANTLNQASAQQKERLDNTTQAITILTDKHTKEQEALRQAVEGRLDIIRQENVTKLDEMRQTVDEKLQSTLETRLGESFNRVVEQLNLVHQSMGEMKDLASNVGNLKNALTNVKVRGTFGEVQLSMLLEEFLTPDQYVKDATVHTYGSERVEYAIKFRISSDGDEILLPVDAKFPREDYEHLIEATEKGDAELIERFRRQFENRLRNCAKDIRDKYINPPHTTDFAILFLPTESLYAEALRLPGLFDYLQRECRVTMAGPTTFAAILNAFQMSFRSLAIAQRSTEVWHILGAVGTEFSKYNEVVDRIGKQINTAATSVENLGRRTRAMNRKLKNVEALPDVESAQKVLGLTADGVLGEDEDCTERRPASGNGSEFATEEFGRPTAT
jgi:DNA recombination protein RmuC